MGLLKLFIALHTFMALTQSQPPLDTKTLGPEIINLFDSYRTDFINVDDTKDCNINETMNHQRWIKTVHPGLWQYRRSHHKKIDKDYKEENDDGSVILLNWDDTVLRLSCPCKEHVTTWKMNGRGSKDFNEDYKGETRSRITIKAPAQRNYYRVYSCHVKGGKAHYFNVFTRPLAVTEPFSVNYLEKLGDAEYNKEITVHCAVSGLDFENVKNQKPTYVADPYQFYWKFPDGGPDRTSEEIAANRPSEDYSDFYSLYWPEHKSQSLKPRDPKYGLNTKLKIGIPSKEMSKAANDYCKTEVDFNVESSISIRSPITYENHSGTFSCIVVDGNGLSSAFWWDGDDPPHEFRGHLFLHVRDEKWIYIAIGFIAGLILLVPICIFALPDNKEDLDSDPVDGDSNAQNAQGSQNANSTEGGGSGGNNSSQPAEPRGGPSASKLKKTPSNRIAPEGGKTPVGGPSLNKIEQPPMNSKSVAGGPDSKKNRKSLQIST